MLSRKLSCSPWGLLGFRRIARMATSSKAKGLTHLPSGLREEIVHVINTLKTEHRVKDDGYIELKECNLCSKPNKDKVDNIWKLNIRPDGSYYCYRCSMGGSFQDLRRKANASITAPSSNREVLSEFSDGFESGSKKAMYPNQVQTHQFHENLFPLEGHASNAKETKHRESALKYLNEVRGINDEILKKYMIGYGIQQFISKDSEEWVDHVCITFPILESADHVDGKNISFHASAASNPKAKKPISIQDKELYYQRVKFRSIQSKSCQRLFPKGGAWGYFGWHTTYLNPSCKTIIITEGELDCMAVAQALSTIKSSSDANRKKLLGVPVVSLPNGCNSFPSELIPFLDKFTKIYLYMDYDEPGQQGAEKIVRKLGPGRCFIVRPQESMADAPKDANDALRRPNGEDLIIRLLLSAQQLTHQHIETFTHLRSSIMQYIASLNNPDPQVSEFIMTYCKLKLNFNFDGLCINCLKYQI